MRHKRCWPCDQEFLRRRGKDFRTRTNNLFTESFSKMPQKPGGAIQHQSSRVSNFEQEQGLLTDKPAVRKALLRMVIRLEENFHAREDLLQEALVCFWSRARQYPGQRLGWYLQSVNFYLHHLKTSGRSLDSPKHRRAQAAFAGDCAGWRESLDILDFDEGIMSEVHARD